MNPNDKKWLIEKYFNGELTADELIMFRHELQHDKKFAADVKLHGEIETFMKDNDALELRATLDEIHEELAGKKKQAAKKIIRMFPRPWQNVAAAILLITALSAVLYFSLRPSLSRRLYAQYYKTYEASEIVRGNTPQPNDIYNKAMDAYENDDYKTSYNLFTEFCNMSSLSDSRYAKANFFKGTSAMENENFDDAIFSFGVVVKIKKSLFAEPALWYQALCYLRKDEKEKALEVFEKISSGNSFYKNNAKEILEKLKK
ncbi:MAG: hypothetical protein V1904_09700 [Bacteroidota bacterium]